MLSNLTFESGCRISVLYANVFDGCSSINLYSFLNWAHSTCLFQILRGSFACDIRTRMQACGSRRIGL
jgi:hypothetical protein